MKPHKQFIMQLLKLGICPADLVKYWGVPQSTAYKYYRKRR
jgi:hypothetical protein